jgi:hypothetical protein
VNNNNEANNNCANDVLVIKDIVRSLNSRRDLEILVVNMVLIRSQHCCCCCCCCCYLLINEYTFLSTATMRIARTSLSVTVCARYFTSMLLRNFNSQSEKL